MSYLDTINERFSFGKRTNSDTFADKRNNISNNLGEIINLLENDGDIMNRKDIYENDNGGFDCAVKWGTRFVSPKFAKCANRQEALDFYRTYRKAVDAGELDEMIREIWEAQKAAAPVRKAA